MRKTRELPKYGFFKSIKINATNIILDVKMLTLSPQDQENKTKMLLSQLLYNIALEVQSSVISQEKDLLERM